MQSRFWCGRLSVGTKPVFGAAGLGTAQSWFWSRHKAGFGAVGVGSAQSRFLEQAQSRFWSGWFRVGTKPVWSRHKAGLVAVGLGSAQSRFGSKHKVGFGAAGYKTGFVSKTGFASSIEATKLDLFQNGRCLFIKLSVYLWFFLW